MKKLLIGTNLGDVWTICLDLKGLAPCSNLLIWLCIPLGISGRKTAEIPNILFSRANFLPFCMSYYLWCFIILFSFVFWGYIFYPFLHFKAFLSNPASRRLFPLWINWSVSSPHHLLFQRSLTSHESNISSVKSLFSKSCTLFVLLHKETGWEQLLCSHCNTYVSYNTGFTTVVFRNVDMCHCHSLPWFPAFCCWLASLLFFFLTWVFLLLCH